MDKFLSMAGNIISMLALLAFVGYLGFNTAYDLGTISQSADAGMFQDWRDMLVIPGFVLSALGLGLSTTYVLRNREDLNAIEMAAPIAIPAVALIGLSLFVFVL